MKRRKCHKGLTCSSHSGVDFLELSQVCLDVDVILEVMHPFPALSDLHTIRESFHDRRLESRPIIRYVGGIHGPAPSVVPNPCVSFEERSHPLDLDAVRGKRGRVDFKVVLEFLPQCAEHGKGSTKLL